MKKERNEKYIYIYIFLKESKDKNKHEAIGSIKKKKKTLSHRMGKISEITRRKCYKYGDDKNG